MSQGYIALTKNQQFRMKKEQQNKHTKKKLLEIKAWLPIPYVSGEAVKKYKNRI